MNAMKKATVSVALPVFLAVSTAVRSAGTEADSAIQNLNLPKASRLLALLIREPGNSALRRRIALEYEKAKVCQACSHFFLLTARYLEGENVAFDSANVFRKQHESTFLMGPGHKVHVSTSVSERPFHPEGPYRTQAEEQASDLRKQLGEDYTAWREVAHKTQLALDKHGWKDCSLLQVLSNAWLYGWIFQKEKLGGEKAELAVRLVFEIADGIHPCSGSAARDLYLLASSLSFQGDHVSAFVASALAVDYARRWESTGSEEPGSFIKRVTDFKNTLEKLARPYRQRNR